MPRYVSGSSTFSKTVRSPIRLKLWKMNPISRLRTRARSDAASSATGRLLSMYCPSVGESSNPRIDSSVDLPQPDGPAMETYSPFPISMWMPDKACVSTSSVKNTFVTPSSLISACLSSAMLISSLLQSNPVVGIVGRHVGQDDLIADLEARENLHGVHGTATELHLRPLGVHAVSANLEEADHALFLSEGRTPHVEHVHQTLELDRAVDAQVRHRALRQVTGECHVHGSRAVLDGW